MTKSVLKHNNDNTKRVVALGALYLFLIVWILIFSKGNLMNRFSIVSDPSTQALFVGIFTVPVAIVALIIGYLHTANSNIKSTMRLLGVLGIAVVIVALSLFTFSRFYS